MATILPTPPISPPSHASSSPPLASTPDDSFTPNLVMSLVDVDTSEMADFLSSPVSGVTTGSILELRASDVDAGALD